MSLDPMADWEKRIVDVFVRHLSEVHQAAQAMSQAAGHGEDPAYARYVQPLVLAAQKGSPEEVAQMWASVLPAVISTVREFLQASEQTPKP